jgi:hypothetical protein
MEVGGASRKRDLRLEARMNLLPQTLSDPAYVAEATTAE